MADTIEIVTPPSIEPVTLAEAKSYLRVEITDDDAMIGGLITAARMAVETELRQAFIATQFRIHFDYLPFSPGYFNRTIRQMGLGPAWLPQQGGGVFILPVAPLITVDAITYYDTNGTLQTISSGTYRAAPGSPGRVQPVLGAVWPISAPIINSVQILFTAGYGTTEANVPPPAQTAIKQLVFDYYNRRTPIGTLTPNVHHILACMDHGSYV